MEQTIPECRLDDARLTAIGHIGQLVDSTILILTFINRHLLPLDGAWWDEVYKAPFAPFHPQNRSVLINNLTGDLQKFSSASVLWESWTKAINKVTGHEVIEAVAPRRIIPIHWDDFSLPLDQPLIPMPRLIDDFAKSMAFLHRQASETKIDLRILPAWIKADPFANL